ncbi:hypothetical protein SAMN05446037_1010114 [Anaerovirgula multivorans]|uniref:Uncharacterized protein n=1 Tax=Anaerovirgula multivorans TaxID=312168 RepID=A0A239EM95_9FIRM|nr:hypothetical protein [Anaerovirgula multivorans]SNS45785.1 hypothetical protein SAMN05446037_1010114 [Anaerovirgula multivorans]
MFNYFISISFLGIILIPVILIFLTLIQSIGEDVRKVAVNTKEKQTYYKTSLKKETYPQRLRRIK